LSEKSDEEKLRILLSHWMEHNSGHAVEFGEWAAKAKKLGLDDVHDAIIEAAQQIRKGNEFLQAALENLREG
jgi:hypothetical protein